MSEETEKQYKKQYDWLKGYQWMKGQSGNPGGRPKGKSLKTFAREYLISLPDEEKIEYIKTMPEDLVWKMAEGNPDSKTDITTDGESLNRITPEDIEYAKKIKQLKENGINRGTKGSGESEPREGGITDTLDR